MVEAYQELYRQLFFLVIGNLCLNDDGSVSREARELAEKMDRMPSVSFKEGDRADRIKTEWGLAVSAGLYNDLVEGSKHVRSSS